MIKHRLGNNGRRRGQALLLAIIVMIMLALVAAAMIAAVSFALENSGRDEQKVRARLLAEAGLRFADDQLTSSAVGADWRPALPAYLIPDADTVNKHLPADATFDPNSQALYWDSFELLRGWDGVSQQGQATGTPVYYVKYRFGMDPEAASAVTETPVDDPSQDFVNRTSPVRPVENDEQTAPHDHFLLKIEYQPGAPLPNGQPDPLSKYLKITSIGRPGGQITAFQELTAYKPISVQDYLLYIHDRNRQGTPAVLGLPATDIDGDERTMSTGRGTFASGAWTAGGANDFIPFFLQGPVRSNVDLQVLAPAMLEPVQPGSGANRWQEKVEVAGAISQVVDKASKDSSGAPTGNSEVLVENADGTQALFGQDNTPAPISQAQAQTPASQPWPTQLEVGTQRIEAPTLESFEPMTGVSRWDRLTRYSGTDVKVTINGQDQTVNNGEFGYGQGIYLNNRRQRDLLATAANTWLHPETWGGRQYVPNGCVIELYAHYPNELDTSLDPAIVITRTDGSTWLDPLTGASTGRRTQVFNFPDKNAQTPWGAGGTNGWRPKNGLIVCDGNVRIYGRLPASAVAPGTTGDRDYNLTVYSRGTIYVDGPLLRPSDYNSAIAEDAPENTRIALLARDNVVLNPTTLAPGPVPGMPPAPWAVPTGDPADAHWDLDPNGTQAVGIRAAVVQPRYSGNRHVLVEEADGNEADGAPAYTSVIFNKVRATLGLAPGVANPATATASQLLSRDSSNNLRVPGQTGVGVPVFFPDWRNLSRALYPAAGNTQREYAPDDWGVSFDNWNQDAAAEEPGVPSYLVIQGGTNQQDVATKGGLTSRSDLIVKNAKVDRYYGANNTTEPDSVRPGLDFVVSALLFAERGSFYVVPGDWFDARATSLANVRDANNAATSDDTAAARLLRLKRYNYRITVNGAIAVNQWASLMDVGAWTEKWCYPPEELPWNTASGTVANTGMAMFNDFDAVRYRYDWGFRTVGGRPNLPRLPGLPASPGLVYAGAENKR